MDNNLGFRCALETRVSRNQGGNGLQDIGRVYANRPAKDDQLHEVDPPFTALNPGYQ
jgi:hypothetical protein